jgi:hypothetical protein
MIPDAFRPALYAQLLYAALAIAWQLVGVALISSGRPPLGPTASLAVAFQGAIVAGLYVLALRRSPPLFVVLSVVSAAAAGATIATAFTADPTLWPSDARRYLGVAVNGVGLVALVLAIRGYVRWRRTEPAQRN